MYKRIVIKLSGEAFQGAGSLDGRKLYDEKVTVNICKQLISLAEKGVQVSIVLGGGNILRGRNVSEGYDRVKADQMGMLATVINSIFIEDVIRLNGGRASVLTPFVIGNMTELYSKDLALRLMENKVIPIYAGGTGHPFFSTDTIPVLRACELNSDCVMFAKNIDGVYSADPKSDPNAVKYTELSYKEIIMNDFKAIDMAAIALLKENNIPSLVFSLNEENALIRACDGEQGFGTVIAN